jgi:arylsulfatase A-like enzyme
VRGATAVAGALLAGGLLFGSALRPSTTGDPPARRVVLISIDTLRADRLGAYGAARPTSPTLDALARGGARFASCVAAAPWTPPSHVAMLTGLYPSRNGVQAVTDQLRPGVATLAGEMRAHGFATAAVIASDLVIPCTRCRQDFDSVTEIPSRGDQVNGGPVVVDSGEDVTNAALDWLRMHGARDRFLLFLHYYDVHSDYRPRPAIALRFGADPHNLEPGNNRFLIDNRMNADLPRPAIEQMRRLYDGEIRQLDEVLRGLFDFLQAHGLWEGTLIVVTADHGEEFLEHGGLLHGRTLYEELLHVPLILSGPGIPRGRVVPNVVSLVDLAPTILEAVGVPAGSTLDGHSLMPLLAGDDRSWQNRAASEADQEHRKRMLRAGNLKLIEDRSSGAELYDLASDPGERHNVAADRPAVVADLALAFQRMLPASAPHGPEILSDEARQRLRALGYLDE